MRANGTHVPVPALQQHRLPGRTRFGPTAALTLLLALVLFVFYAPASARAATYPYVVDSGDLAAWYSTGNSLTFSPNTDDGTATVALPFAFTIFGHTYGSGTQLHVSTNGTVQFETESNPTAFSNGPLPTSTFSHPVIMPFWDDFDVTQTYDVILTGAGEGVKWGVFGTSPNRVFAIKWRGYRHATMPESRIAFQVALHEGTNEISMSYVRDLTDPMATGSTATIGIQEGGTSGSWYQYSYNTASVQTDFYVDYYPAVPRSDPLDGNAHPVISGTAALGRTLTVSNGTWSPPGDTFSYLWERCTSLDINSCSYIGGAQSSSYVLQAADVNKYVLAIVTASNGWGTSEDGAFAYPAGPVSGTPTTLTGPTVSGSPVVGATLTSTTGVWAGSPTAYKYWWYRCTADMATCTSISGENASTHVVTVGDVGFRMASAVSAQNGYGWSSPMGSGNTIGPIPSPPTNSIQPHVSGTASVGSTLTTTTGSWSGSPSQYHYKWWRCLGSDPCGTISGATSQNYVIVSADAGYKLFAQVQAYNANGWSEWVSSDNSAGPVPAPPVPANTARPHLSGSSTLGATLTTTNGTWSNSPDQYAYKWARCVGSNPCTEISGAAGKSYVVAVADIGARIFAQVQAHNGNGWSNWVATDNTSDVIAAPPVPANTTRPHVSGSATVGATLTVSPGAWDGSPDDYGYQWWRCMPVSGGCLPSAIAGVTGATYVLAATDVGGKVYVGVRAHNGAGWSGYVITDNTIGPISTGGSDQGGAGTGGDNQGGADNTGGDDNEGGGDDRGGTGNRGGSGGTKPTALKIQSLTLTPSIFRAVRSGGSVGTKGGTRVTFLVNRSAYLEFTVQRVLPGRLAAGRCMPIKPSSRGSRACTRYTLVRGKFGYPAHGLAPPVRTSFRFTGRIGSATLTPGTYRLTAVAEDAAHIHSTAVRVNFRINR